MSDAPVSPNDSAVGRAIREQRLSQHMKQSELARALNVTRATVTRWESGTRPMTIATLLTIAEQLGVPASHLLPERHQLPPAEATRARVLRETSFTSQPAIQAIGQVLDLRPDLIPTVISLLETLLADDDGARAPLLADRVHSRPG